MLLFPFECTSNWIITLWTRHISLQKNDWTRKEMMRSRLNDMHSSFVSHQRISKSVVLSWTRQRVSSKLSAFALYLKDCRVLQTYPLYRELLNRIFCLIASRSKAQTDWALNRKPCLMSSKMIIKCRLFAANWHLGTSSRITGMINALSMICGSMIGPFILTTRMNPADSIRSVLF